MGYTSKMSSGITIQWKLFALLRNMKAKIKDEQEGLKATLMM